LLFVVVLFPDANEGAVDEAKKAEEAEVERQKRIDTTGEKKEANACGEEKAGPYFFGKTFMPSDLNEVDQPEVKQGCREEIKTIAQFSD
jgi:hypothetical protein